MHVPQMLAIAHRAGNSVDRLREALDAGVDLVEADVQALDGRVEVRHHRHLFGSPWVWDGGWLPSRRPPVLELGTVLDALGADARLMLDLKGDDMAFAQQVADVLSHHAPGRALTVCTRSWDLLDVFPTPVRRVLSAGNRLELARLRHRLATEHVDGVSVRLGLLSPAVIADLHGGTDLVMAWSVDSAAGLAKARRVGADGVISKNLALLGQLMVAG